MLLNQNLLTLVYFLLQIHGKNDSVSNQDLEFNDFQLPFRRDREGDCHVGILVYVKMIFRVNVETILN